MSSVSSQQDDELYSVYCLLYTKIPVYYSGSFSTSQCGKVLYTSQWLIQPGISCVPPKHVIVKEICIGAKILIYISIMSRKYKFPLFFKDFTYNAKFTLVGNKYEKLLTEESQIL